MPLPNLSLCKRIGFVEEVPGGQVCSLGSFVLVRGPVPQQVPMTAVHALTPALVQQLKARLWGTALVPATPMALPFSDHW